MKKSRGITGDFNSKIERDVVAGFTGHYGLGERNDRGDSLNFAKNI